jgi:hypothetical protein
MQLPQDQDIDGDLPCTKRKQKSHSNPKAKPIGKGGGRH